MAEGSTNGGMQTYILVENPGEAPAEVTLKFLTGAGEVAGPTDTMPAHTRATFLANDWVTSYDVSTEVTSNNPVVCERATYGGPGRGWAWGTCSTGSPMASAQWYAPGLNAAFSPWLLIANPNDTAASIDIKYYTGSAEVQGPQAVVSARSRATFNVNDTLSGVYASAVITSSGAEVVCEWAEYAPDWSWGASSQASPFASGYAFLTEGSTDGGMRTLVTMFNPTDADVTADLSPVHRLGHAHSGQPAGLERPRQGHLRRLPQRLRHHLRRLHRGQGGRAAGGQAHHHLHRLGLLHRLRLACRPPLTRIISPFTAQGIII